MARPLADRATRVITVQNGVDSVERLAPILGERAARALPRLDAVRGEFRVNVNARLAFEKILLESG